MEKRDTSTIQVINRCAELLSCFSREQNSFSINELSSLTKLNQGTIYRILKTLRNIGWIDQDKLTRKYLLGLELYRLGNLVNDRLLLKNIAHPVLTNVRNKCDETTLLLTIYNEKILTLDCIPGSQFVRAAGDIGEFRQVTTSILCLGLLAYLKESEIINLLPNLDEEKRNKLFSDIAKIREHGYAIGTGDKYSGSLGIGAPIFNEKKEVLAALYLYGPLDRVNQKKDLCIEAIIDGSKIITNSLVTFK